MTRPALFVVKATIAPALEAAFNQWYDTVRSKEAAQVPGCLGMRRYAALPLESAHAGSEDYDARFGAAGDRARLAYRQIYP